MEQYVDILQEVGNIGIGNAATALAEFLSAKIKVTVPQTDFVPVEEVFTRIGRAEELVAAILLRVDGDLSGMVLFLFPEASARELIAQILGQPVAAIQELDDMEESVLLEIGNVLTGSFLNAVSAMTQLTIIPAVPLFTFDMLGAIINSSLLGTGMVEDQVLLIKTVLLQEGNGVSGDLLFFFDIGALDTLLNVLRIQLENISGRVIPCEAGTDR
ncbi:MAG TPA: chemotaxis protein CheC [Desulfotomaculum sp.]|nr:chemotaxis protein CheC [Desulfotomaculum sp.]